MKRPKLRELKEAITAILIGPYTSKFPAEPARVADVFRGKPEFDEDECVGCGACYNVCPPGAIEMTDDAERRIRTLTVNLDRCIYCGQCERNCLTEKGIHQTPEFDLASTAISDLRETVEKKLVFCEACGAVIGAEDHIRWVARKLGALAYSNPTLLVSAMQNMGLADREPPPGEELRRGDRIRLLCPKCRQITSFVV